MSVELSADLVRDYDMTILLDEENNSIASTSSATPTSPTSFLEKDLLAECPINDDVSSSFTSPAQSPKFGEFLLEDELFLTDMQQHDDAINLPDIDMMLPLNPRGNLWHDALQDSEWAESSFLQDGGELMRPSSPWKLTHCDSSFLSDGHINDCVAGSPRLDNDEADADEEDEMQLLQREAKYLTAQKEFLEFKEKCRPSVKRRRGQDPVAELRRLLQSQEENQLLNGRAIQQKMYADNFRAMLVFAPVNDVRMSLATPLESYIRLGKDPSERRKMILSLRKEKLDMTYNFTELKTREVDCNKAYELSDMFDKFGKHYCVSFTISRYDGVSIYQVARGIYNQIIRKDETLNEVIGITAHRESTGTLKCNFMHQRIISRPASVKMPDIESNEVFYCRFSDGFAVLATDYVDRDELHPYDVSRHIRKDMTSGVVLTAHEEDDGKQYVVMKRYMMAKLNMYPHKIPQQNHLFLNMDDKLKKLVVDRTLQHSDAGCSCTSNNTSCCCASEEACIPCGGHV